MAYTLFKVGGSAGEAASLSIDSDGTVTFTDSSGTATTLTAAIYGGLAKISGYVWDLSAAATEAAYFALGANLARAWELRQSSTVYLRAVTTTGKTFMQSVARWKFNSVQAVDMAGAAHALVLGTAGAAQTQLTGNIVTVDANGSGGGTDPQTLGLPTAGDCNGAVIYIINTGGETVTLGDTFSTAIAAGKGAWVACNGTVWAGVPGA